MTAAKSFKSMIKDGEIKRADAMKVRLEDIHEEPGFNLRAEGEDLEQSIESLAQFIAQGGQVPPLEVRPRAEGGVWLVDGHRRRRAFGRIADSIRDASGELWLPVVPFSGNDAERVARVITSQEGRKLNPLELAEGYKRLTAFNWTPEQIAQKVGKTRQHVDQMLVLASAPTAVQQMVTSGEVAAATAVEVVRKHGDESGAVLSGELDKAKAAGKSKVTAGTMKPKALPREIVEDLVQQVCKVSSRLTTEDRVKLDKFHRGEITEGTVVLDIEALLHLELCLDELKRIRADQEAKAREKADKAKQLELTGGEE
jgi:ParB family chromosome partitioning protein